MSAVSPTVAPALALAPASAPSACQRGRDDLPFVDLGGGTELQLLTRCTGLCAAQHGLADPPVVLVDPPA